MAAYSGSPALPTTSTPAAPGALITTVRAVSNRVPTAAMIPRGMLRPGSAASSAAEATCSRQMNIQMAKGTQANTPATLTPGRALPAPGSVLLVVASRFSQCTWGSMAPPKASRAMAATAPARRVSPRASPTPMIWMPMITANRPMRTGQPPKPNTDSM